MSGPNAKPSSTRARRNPSTNNVRTLKPNARRGKKAPAWPLLPDVRATAELEASRDRMAKLQVELEETTDNRKKGRLRRELTRLEMSTMALELQIDQARDAEVSLWAELWAMPVATLWEESHAQREVAQYVRWKVKGEAGDLDAAKEARMLSDRLGLNPLALIRLRAEIERADEAEARGDRRRTAAAQQHQQPPATGGKGKGKGDDGDPRGGLFAVS